MQQLSPAALSALEKIRALHALPIPVSTEKAVQKVLSSLALDDLIAVTLVLNTEKPQERTQ